MSYLPESDDDDRSFDDYLDDLDRAYDLAEERKCDALVDDGDGWMPPEPDDDEGYACDVCGHEFGPDEEPMHCQTCRGTFCSPECHDEVSDPDAEREAFDNQPAVPLHWYRCSCGAKRGYKTAQPERVRVFCQCGGEMTREPDEEEPDVRF